MNKGKETREMRTEPSEEADRLASAVIGDDETAYGETTANDEREIARSGLGIVIIGDHAAGRGVDHGGHTAGLGIERVAGSGLSFHSGASRQVH